MTAFGRFVLVLLAVLVALVAIAGCGGSQAAGGAWCGAVPVRD
jgi:hypothetical protein